MLWRDECVLFSPQSNHTGLLHSLLFHLFSCPYSWRFGKMDASLF